MLKFICFALLFTLPLHVHAKESVKTISIAVIDVQQLMNDSKAAKSIQYQGTSLRKKYQGQIEKLEGKLKRSEEKVIEAGKEKNQEKFLESRKNFQEDLVESQKKYREMNSHLDRAVASALNKLRDEIVEIVDDMADKRGYDLVLTRADVITVSKDIDITAEVMRRLNKETKYIKVRD